MKMARRIILWLLLGIFMASILGGPIIYRYFSLKQDIHTAEGLYLGIKPDYNIDFPISHSFAPWENAAYPVTGIFSSSTEYFVNLMTNQWLMGCNYGIFALTGVPPYWGVDPHNFHSANNAWCIALDYDPHKLPDAPFMFSRNLDILHLSEAHPDRLRNIAPYGLKGVLVVKTDGSVIFIPSKRIESEFNPLGLTNAVLRP